MRTFLAGAALALLLVPAAQAQVSSSVYGADNSRIARQPRKLKPPEPLARKAFDRAVEQMFAAADGNRDGLVTGTEFTAAVEARKTRVVAERFAAIDRDRDQSIDMAEFAEWQRGLGAAVLDEEASGGRQIGELVAEDLRPELGGDGPDRVLARVIVPLNALALATANADYDAGTSLAELLAFEGREFDKVDLNKDGWLTADEYRGLFPRGDGAAPAAPPPG